MGQDRGSRELPKARPKYDPAFYTTDGRSATVALVILSRSSRKRFWMGNRSSRRPGKGLRLWGGCVPITLWDIALIFALLQLAQPEDLTVSIHDNKNYFTKSYISLLVGCYRFSRQRRLKIHDRDRPPDRWWLLRHISYGRCLDVRWVKERGLSCTPTVDPRDEYDG